MLIDTISSFLPSFEPREKGVTGDQRADATCRYGWEVRIPKHGQSCDADGHHRYADDDENQPSPCCDHFALPRLVLLRPACRFPRLLLQINIGIPQTEPESEQDETGAEIDDEFAPESTINAVNHNPDCQAEEADDDCQPIPWVRAEESQEPLDLFFHHFHPLLCYFLLRSHRTPFAM